MINLTEDLGKEVAGIAHDDDQDDYGGVGSEVCVEFVLALMTQSYRASIEIHSPEEFLKNLLDGCPLILIGRVVLTINELTRMVSQRVWFTTLSGKWIIKFHKVVLVAPSLLRFVLLQIFDGSSGSRRTIVRSVLYFLRASSKSPRNFSTKGQMKAGPLP